MEVTCSVSVDGQEKQEFSFTLYDFDTCDKANKQKSLTMHSLQDVEKVVVRSICEALGKTLKLPPSGSRTIKVKLAISPDSSKDIDTKEPLAEWPSESYKVNLPSKPNDCCSAQSANTTSTYLPSSHSEKPPKYCSPSLSKSPQVVCMSDTRGVPSPKLRPARQTKLHKYDVRDRIAMQMNASDNRHQHDEMFPNCFEEPSPYQKHPSSRDHVPECKDRRNHYLDLAGVESSKHNNLSQPKLHPESSGSPRMDSKYVCPYHILDRSHTCSKPHRSRDSHSSPLKKQPPCHSKLNIDAESSPRMYRTKVNRDLDDDFLNLNVDLRDLVPEAKFDWEKPHHRRSKSYDLYENDFAAPGGLYSPKLKPRTNQNWTPVLESQKLSNHMPSSPGHHYRHRHRDRDRQRAIQQVANWIAREHSSPKSEAAKHFICSSIAPNPSHRPFSERHEHHHHHEHVHHHYHHFVEL